MCDSVSLLAPEVLLQQCQLVPSSWAACFQGRRERKGRKTETPSSWWGLSAMSRICRLTNLSSSPRLLCKQIFIITGVSLHLDWCGPAQVAVKSNPEASKELEECLQHWDCVLSEECAA